MTATTDGTAENIPTSQEKSTRTMTPLGRRHGVLATISLVVSSAAIIYAAGSITAAGPTHWSDHAIFIGCVAVFFAAAFYFTKAYGFSFRGMRHAPGTAHYAVGLGYMVVVVFVSPALHETYGGDRELTLILSCLGIAALALVPLAAVLGWATERAPRKPADEYDSSS